MQTLHASGLGGHSGVKVTLHRVSQYFFWPTLAKDIKHFVAECDVCQRSKNDNVAYPGLLQPLPVPERRWSDIFMDFITGLPKSMGKEVIFVVVDRLTKYGHFINLAHPYTTLFCGICFL